MGCESSYMVRFDLGRLFQGQIRVVKHKRAYNSHTIAPTFSGCETNIWKTMGWESCSVA